MDMVKFTSLVVNEALYFACPIEFQDPYEGYYPKSHIEALEEITQPLVADLTNFINTLKRDGADTTSLDHCLQELPLKFKEALKISSEKFGVSCWHQSEYESDAMWKLYSALNQCIAVESTIDQLQGSIKEELRVEPVRYLDFHNDPIGGSDRVAAKSAIKTVQKPSLLAKIVHFD